MSVSIIDIATGAHLHLLCMGKKEAPCSGVDAAESYRGFRGQFSSSAVEKCCDAQATRGTDTK